MPTLRGAKIKLGFNWSYWVKITIMYLVKASVITCAPAPSMSSLCLILYVNEKIYHCPISIDFLFKLSLVMEMWGKLASCKGGKIVIFTLILQSIIIICCNLEVFLNANSNFSEIEV